MNRYSRVIGLLTLLVGATACGGSAIDLDLDRPQGSDTARAGAPGHFSTVSVPTRETLRLWADDSSVYWVVDEPPGATLSCVFDDCGATLVKYADVSGPFVVAPRDVFFPATPVFDPSNRTGQTFFRCSKAGCDGAPAEWVHDPDSDQWNAAFAADTSWFYWASKFDVYRCPLSGCGEVPERVAARLSDDLPTPNDSPRYFLLLAGDSVYWTGNSGTGDGNSVYSAAKDGSRTAERVTTVEGVFSADENRLYWVDGSFHVVSCPLAHCDDFPPTVLVTTSTTKIGLSVDDRGLYWLEFGPVGSDPATTSAVYFCPLSGCTPGVNPRRLTSTNVAAFATSPSYVYWTEFPTDSASNGRATTIFRVPKPAG